MNILHIDSSILGEHSASHRLSAAVVARLLEAEPDASVVYRDLAIDSVPQLNGALANIANVPLDQQSAELRHDVAKLAAVVDEVVAADVIVVGAPMYNFGISTQLKSWVDALAVPGKTFRYGPDGAEGLLGGKRVVIASARGGFYGADTPLAALDHQETYLRNVLSDFFGVKRFEIVRAEGLKVSPEMYSRGMEAGLRQAAELRISWVVFSALACIGFGCPLCAEGPVLADSFMTSLAETEEKVTGFKAGAVDYVTKPLRVDEVFARVSTHLNLRAMQKKLEAQNASCNRRFGAQAGRSHIDGAHAGH